MDYSIYIHSVGEYSSPTTPREVSGNEETGGVGGTGGGGSGFGMARRALAFASNPDSVFGMIRAGFKTFMPLIVMSAAANITDKVITMYDNYAAPASGNYEHRIEYANFKQYIHNATHPFQTEIARQQAQLQIKRQNAINEQQMLLTGGTILNNPNGRFL